jgi:hypothetical protein
MYDVEIHTAWALEWKRRYQVGCARIPAVLALNPPDKPRRTTGWPAYWKQSDRPAKSEILAALELPG